MNTSVILQRNTREQPPLDLSEIFNEMLRLDAKATGIGRVQVLMGSRKRYAEYFEKACETVLTRHMLCAKLEQSNN